MTVTEEGRHRLHQALDRTVGEEEATTLMEHLPPVGWADVATKQDLDHLREHVDGRFDREREYVDLRFDAVDHRFDAAQAHGERLHDATRADVEGVRGDTRHLARLVEAYARATDQRMEQIEMRLAAIDARLTQQFWQFLTVIVAFGAILIGVLRYT
jgi:hypothetical protein